MTIQLETSLYERTHGKKPRGDGYWAFSFPYGPQHLRSEIVFLNGTLTECRKKLAAQYPFISTARVLP